MSLDVNLLQMKFCY